MLNGAIRFVQDIYGNQPPRWLTMLGTSGAGKSMLMERIIKWAGKYQEMKLDPRFNPQHVVKYRKVGLLRWSNCCALMMRGDYGWIEQAKRDWIVALDDVGTEYEKIRALSTSKLYEILEARRGLWTIITANLSVQEIADKMDTRIASRLFRDGSDIFDVNVPDYNVTQFNLRNSKPTK